MQPTKFYIGVIGFFLAALVFGGMFFLTGMGNSSYLISDGVAYGVHYIDKPRYDSNMQGFIFVLSFLGAGLLLCLLVILPDRQTQAAKAQAAPQPRRRPAAPQAAPQAAPPPPPQAAPVAAPAQPPADRASAAANHLLYTSDKPPQTRYAPSVVFRPEKPLRGRSTPALTARRTQEPSQVVNRPTRHRIRPPFRWQFHLLVRNAG